jgi:hypothetical protein
MFQPADFIMNTLVLLALNLARTEQLDSPRPVLYLSVILPAVLADLVSFSKACPDSCQSG